jgi:vesicle coat complex subunit
MEDLASKLNRIVQLTGFSDPVYAEAYVNVHQYDILMGIVFSVSFFNSTKVLNLFRYFNCESNERNTSKFDRGIFNDG